MDGENTNRQRCTGLVSLFLPGHGWCGLDWAYLDCPGGGSRSRLPALFTLRSLDRLDRGHNYRSFLRTLRGHLACLMCCETERARVHVSWMAREDSADRRGVSFLVVDVNAAICLGGILSFPLSSSPSLTCCLYMGANHSCPALYHAELVAALYARLAGPLGYLI